MNLQSKFGYCIIIQTLNIGLCLYAGRNYGQTKRRTDNQTDDSITRCPGQTFQAGGIKIPYLNHVRRGVVAHGLGARQQVKIRNLEDYITSLHS